MIICEVKISNFVTFQNCNFSKFLRDYVKEARHRYNEARQEKAKSKLNSDKDLKKEALTEKIQEVSSVILYLENVITQLKRESEKFALQVEDKVDFTYLIKANARKKEVEKPLKRKKN